MAVEITDTPFATLDKISMDCMGPLPLTEYGNKYILSYEEQLSKYLTDIPIRNQEAETMPRAMVENVVAVFGSPGSIFTNCSSKFTGEFMRLLCRHLKISKIITILFRPHSNANIEKSHAIIITTFYLQRPKQLVHIVANSNFRYNTTPHTQNKWRPFELIIGREPSVPGLLHSRSHYPDYRERKREREMTL